MMSRVFAGVQPLQRSLVGFNILVVGFNILEQF